MDVADETLFFLMFHYEINMRHQVRKLSDRRQSSGALYSMKKPPETDSEPMLSLLQMDFYWRGRWRDTRKLRPTTGHGN